MMDNPFLPIPQRFTRLSIPAHISHQTPVVLQMPYREERLIHAVYSLFDTVSISINAKKLCPFLQGRKKYQLRSLFFLAGL